jgi:predicted DNA-binding transcriptional regulator YafY
MQREAGGNVPLQIYHDGHKVYYRYSDPKFSILNLPISQEEMEIISDTIKMLRRFKGMPNYYWMDQILVQFENMFHLNGEVEEAVAFAQNEQLIGLEYFSPILDSIVEKKVLSIEYRPYGKDSRVYQIHPYQLRQYNNRWFLVGYESNQTIHPIMILALDRIRDIQVSSNITYIPFKNGSIDNLFKDIVGVSIAEDSPVQEIILKAYRPTADYIRTKPIHSSQVIVLEGDESITFKMSLKINYELETLLLSYADKCEIISPIELRECISERARKILENNQKK